MRRKLLKLGIFFLPAREVDWSVRKDELARGENLPANSLFEVQRKRGC
jgi:hypothetical protein